MSTRVTQVEKELMWKLYQKYGTFKAVAQRMGRGAGTVSAMCMNTKRRQRGKRKY